MHVSHQILLFAETYYVATLSIMNYNNSDTMKCLETVYGRGFDAY